ncbi:unnamed protein product [Rangifer tarandus platyrhynchus]|uniref:Uncharacterized protein n=1 Tax=Rangifer tarandus platyrhynchus TaxID=3082113 RepID=A0ABN8YY92_RANTA|nr:unnamed protein product [Rangifer tarandus platyrhynchus]
MTQQKRHEGNVETETQHSEGAAPPPAWKTEAVWAAGRGQGCGSSGPKVKIQGEASAENTGVGGREKALASAGPVFQANQWTPAWVSSSRGSQSASSPRTDPREQAGL